MDVLPFGEGGGAGTPAPFWEWRVGPEAWYLYQRLRQVDAEAAAAVARCWEQRYPQPPPGLTRCLRCRDSGAEEVAGIDGLEAFRVTRLCPECHPLAARRAADGENKAADKTDGGNGEERRAA